MTACAVASSERSFLLLASYTELKKKKEKKKQKQKQQQPKKQKANKQTKKPLVEFLCSEMGKSFGVASWC